MQSAAYIHGALDAFVKAGEMSPAFAAGVADVLTKEAGIFSSVGDDVLGAIKQYRKDHPDAWDPVAQRLNITPEDAYALVINIIVARIFLSRQNTGATHF